MKKFIKLHGRNSIILICFIILFASINEISDLFLKVREINSRSTEGFSNNKIEFVFDTDLSVDFSYLDKMDDDCYAILIRDNSYEPIYRIVHTANYFCNEDKTSFFSLNNLDNDKTYYFSGKKASDLFELNLVSYLSAVLNL